jgi:hypothetical protein
MSRSLHGRLLVSEADLSSGCRLANG